jgi:mono/diheme cytochrome c family protein
MEFTPTRGWNLPDGAAVMQTLTRNGRKLETRVLLKQQNEWAGYSYAWNDAQTDASLVAAAGETRNDWRIPSRQECAVCHTREAGFLLGVSTVQLHRDGQIARWERMGLISFTDKPEKDTHVEPAVAQRAPVKTPLLPIAPEKLPRLAADTVEARARAYLHANCSHCHVRNGGGNSPFQFASHVADMEVINAAPTHGDFGIADARVVAPGAPERSLLIYRTILRGAGQMPPLGTRQTDGGGVATLVEWVQSLKP